MSIRTFCLGLAAVLGFAQAAQAATIVDYDFKLRYEGTAFYDVVIAQPGVDPDPLFIGSIGVRDYNWGLPGVYHHLPIGAHVRFTASVFYPGEPVTWTEQYDNGGSVSECSLAGVACGATRTELTEDGFVLGISDHTDIQKSGNALHVTYWGRYHFGENYDYGLMRTYDIQTAYFTILDEPAPVPLPASAGFLAAAMGGLAMLRRRRRHRSS